MLIMHVHIQVLPQHLEEFKQATIVNATHSLEEPGITRFDVLQSREDPTRFVLVEVYHNQEANAAHKQTPHYHAWLERVGHMFAGERTRSFFDNVFPDDRGW